MNTKKDIESISFDELYLLGWYDRIGRSHLTSWEDDGSMEHVQVVVTGDGPVPLWGNEPSPYTKAYLVPENREWGEYATELNGCRAFGWRVSKSDKDYAEMLKEKM